MGGKILVAKGVNKVFNLGKNNQKIILKDISLEVKEGEFVCVMGPSGSGKTALINNISTIDLPTNGHIVIDGENILSMDERSLSNFRNNTLGFIFQSYNVVDSLTMFENIRVPLLIGNHENEYIDKEIERIGKELRIEKLLHKYPRECTVGQRQKVAFARALVTKPKLLIADEPTHQLDSTNTYEILEIVNKINKDNISVIMVTHDPLIARFSSKVVYVKDGMINQVLVRDAMSQEEYYEKIEQMCIENNIITAKEVSAVTN